jgi:glucokinase
MAATVIAGDLGGTNLRAAIVDEDGNILLRRQVDTPESASRDEITAIVVELFRTVAREGSERAAALCVATAGLVDADGGRVLLAANIPGFRDIVLTPPLTDALGIPSFIENDASAAALGEFRFGAGRGARHLLHVTVGTGIGGGIVIGGHLHRGEHGFAGEIGHTIIEPAGPRCTCGSRGCLEAVVSGTAFARRARELIAAGKSAQLKALAAESGDVTSNQLFEAARAGDPVCEAEIRHGGHMLGLGIGSIVNVLDPTRVTLSGGLLAMGDMLLEPARSALRSLPYGPASGASFALSTLGEDAGLLGAAAVAFERLELASGDEEQGTGNVA